MSASLQKPPQGQAKGRTFVAYARVSTQRQGRSGLGLEAQEAAIRGFLLPGDRLLSPVFVEVESGKRSDRPKLAEALALCRTTGATLLIAKLDRLARDVHFISGLMKEGVPFIAADFPDTDPFMLHIRASVAEDEARRISLRTKAALAAAKARGVKLGGDRGYRPATPEGSALGAKRSAQARSLASSQHAHGVLPVVEELRAQGLTSLQQLAEGLTARGITTPRGSAWTATAVRRVLAKVEA
ncbi:MAG TPA: recombinase family protein [Roseomonas sp.]|nr:recombinase family protein [Roseomonas sp.]